MKCSEKNCNKEATEILHLMMDSNESIQVPLCKFHFEQKLNKIPLQYTYQYFE